MVGTRTRSLLGIVVIGFLVLGIATRAYHYGRDPSMWSDEAAVAINVLKNDYSELLGPLLFAEAAPPLFLWVERAIAQSLGDGTYALRLIPFLASIALLLVAVPLHVRWVGLTGAAFSVGLLAMSDRLHWHACEAKPYALDAFAALSAAGLFCLTRRLSLNRQLVLWMILSPAIIWLVYPGAFIVGGLMLGLFIRIQHDRRKVPVLLFGGLIIAVAGSFLALYLGPAQAQRCGPMDSCWTTYFPDYSRPLTIPIWILTSTVGVLDYSFRPLGGILLPAALFGVVSMTRRGMGSLAIVSAAPIVLAFIASLLGKYPYGGARVMVFAAPALALFVGEAVSRLASMVVSRTSTLRISDSASLLPSVLRSQNGARFALGVMGLALVASTVISLWTLSVPWKRLDAKNSMQFVLMQRSAEEPVVANFWEHEYYARSIEPSFIYMTPPVTVEANRFWLVVAAAKVNDREALAELVDAASYRPISRREFEGTSVILFERTALARPEKSTNSR